MNKGIIANPNCSTIQAMVALKPLQDKYGIKRVVYSTYQAVSGSGVKGINDLKNGLGGDDEHLQAYAHPIAGNCLPHIDVFTDNGYTKEEMKMINETHKILGDDDSQRNCHCRKSFRQISQRIYQHELEKLLEFEDVVELFKNPGNHRTGRCGTQRISAGKRRCRNRRSLHRTYQKRLLFGQRTSHFAVADNIRKGATNAIQIAENWLPKWTTVVLPDTDHHFDFRKCYKFSAFNIT